MSTEYIISTFVVVYFFIMLWTFITSVRHFIGWFHNSIPPKNIFGQVFEMYTMFFNRYLTKEGVEHKNKFLRWFGITMLMAAALAIIITLLKKSV